MPQLEFTESDKQAFSHKKFHPPHPRAQLKMEVLWLKSQGLLHGQICQLAEISENTLRKYLRDYTLSGHNLILIERLESQGKQGVEFLLIFGYQFKAGRLGTQGFQAQAATA